MLRPEVPVMDALICVAMGVVGTVGIVGGFAVALLVGFGHERECVCGCLADPESTAGMCADCERVVLIAAGACLLCLRRRADPDDDLCVECAASVAARVEREWL